MNPSAPTLASVDVVILCGGRGTRLQSVVPDRPKGLASVQGRALLDILVDDVVAQGLRRIIFCVGYLKEQIIAHFSGRSEAEFVFSEETSPLGTGGAVKHAIGLIKSDPFLVMNGDSFCSVDFKKFYLFHHAKMANASFVLTQADDRYDGGVVCLDEMQKIRIFLEKSKVRGQHDRFINAGMYLMQREAVELQYIAPPFSLEYDVFPTLVKTKACFGFVVQSQLVDIGTPERYSKANKDCRQ